MMKWLDLASCQAASAVAEMENAATATANLTNKPMIPPNSEQLQASQSAKPRKGLKEAVGVNVDSDANLARPFELGEPVSDYILDI